MTDRRMREGGERADRTCSAATVEEMKGWILEKGAGGPQGKGRSPEGERRVVTLDGTTEDSDDVLNVLGVFEVLELLELLDFSSDIHSRPCILSPPVQVDALGCHSPITLEGRGSSTLEPGAPPEAPRIDTDGPDWLAELASACWKADMVMGGKTPEQGAGRGTRDVEGGDRRRSGKRQRRGRTEESSRAAQSRIRRVKRLTEMVRLNDERR
ncbi:hypothetical protein JCM24511_06376 [Saitozyma sp. JCM 24511]|nr:hypothetical protein JCM24511_06376 [Saitozyma sp. JCM 24511]